MKVDLRRHLIALAAPAALMPAFSLIAGCGSNTYSTAEPIADVRLQERVIRNPGLALDIKITGAKLIDSAGNAIGQITVQNTSGSERRIALRWSWMDRDGGSLTLGEQPWLDYTLAGGEIREISSAGGRDGADFRVSVKSVR